MDYKESGKLFKPDKIINWTYLMEPDEHGKCFRAKVIKQIVNHEEGHGINDPEVAPFLVRIEGDDADEIVSYNQIVERINQEIEWTNDPDNEIWTFQDIVAHEG